MTSTSCWRRLPRDIIYIKNHIQGYDIYDATENPDKTLNITMITPNQNRLDFTIPSSYPFKPPLSLHLNGKNYRYLMKKIPPRIEYLYTHPSQFYQDEINTNIPTCYECLCCKSLLCADNWSPIHSLHHILFEIHKHNDLKRGIMYKLLLKELFDDKWLPLEIIPIVYAYL